MNIQFKDEFKNLNADEIKEIINRCAGHDILTTIGIGQNCCFIKYMENDSYGFWDIEWGWEPAKYDNMMFGGQFAYRIKITPFKVEYENTHKSSNPFSLPNKRKNTEEYLQVYINRKCPNYKQAVREETEKFIKMLEYGNNDEMTF